MARVRGLRPDRVTSIVKMRFSTFVIVLLLFSNLYAPSSSAAPTPKPSTVVPGSIQLHPPR